MPANDLYRSYKNIGSAVLEDAANNIYVLPTPTETNFDLGTEITEVPTTNSVGEQVIAKRFVSTRDPAVSMTFGNKTPEVVGLKFVSKFELNASKATSVLRSGFTVLADGVVAAAAAGEVGNGVVLNVASNAAYLGPNGLLVTLTQSADFATFDAAATPLEFAIGADNAQLYGQDLWGQYVSWEVPITLTNIVELGETPWGVMSLKILVIKDDLSVSKWTFSKVQPDPRGSISLNEPTQELPFFVNLDSSDCTPVMVEYLGQTQKC